MDKALLGAVVAFSWILVLKLGEFLYKSWWRRREICRLLSSQGIRGPRYNLVVGNYSEMKRMQQEAAATDMPTITHDIVPRVFPFQHKCAQSYGKHFLHWWGNDPIVCIAEPELIVDVLSLKFGHYQKSLQLRKAMEFLFGKGLLVAVEEDWVKQRHVVNSALNTEKIKCLVSAMVPCVKRFITKWEQHVSRVCAEVEIKQDMLDMATEIILRSSFGDNCYDKAKKYPELVYSLLNLTSKSSPFISHFIPSFVPTKKKKLLKEIDKCFQEVIEAHRDGDTDNKDILSSLLNCATKKLSGQQVIDECKNIVFAGHETTAHALTWTMMLLGLHQDWQQKAYEEVTEVCNGGDPTPDMLSKLRVMGMILNESLRLYPPGAQTAREAVGEMKLGKMVIPAGVSVAINIVEVHRDKNLWGEDALEFKPQRFSEGVSKACKQPVGGYLPFLLGPRVCVGQGLALMEAKTTLALILQRFSWRLSPNYRHSPIVALTLQPQHGMQLLMFPRTS